MALHAIAVFIVAGRTIERPVPRAGPAAIGVTLLVDGEEAPVDTAEGAVAARALTTPEVVPEPTPRPRSVVKPRAPARAAPPLPLSPPAEASAGTRSDEDRARPAESGSAAAPAGEPVDGEASRPASGAGGAGPYGEHDVDRVAGPVGGIRRPSYPARERMLGREGRVSLLVTVDPTGTVRDVEVTQSAGEAFDVAARRAVEATPFRPAERRGSAVASTVTVNVSFELD